MKKREIKFRAKIKKSRDIDYKVGNWIYYTTKDVFKNIFGHNLMEIENECEYTGLHDKKGVEIYEGDIVSYALGLEVVGETIWTPIGYFLREKEGGGTFVKEGVSWSELEVIGNVYDNPKLLTN